MKQKQFKFKIINKTLTHVILDMRKAGLVKLTWEDFNRQFNMVKLYWAVPKKEAKKEADKCNTMMNAFCMEVMTRNAALDSLRNLAVGNLFMQLQEKHSLTPAEIIAEASRRIAAFKNPNISLFRESRAERAERKAKEDKQEEKLHRMDIHNAKQSMSEAKGFELLVALQKKEEE